MIGEAKTALTVLLILSIVFVFVPEIVSVQAVGVWDVQIVDVNGAGLTGGNCPIVIDSKNRPRIAYTSRIGNAYRVMYAEWDGSKWNTQIVDYGWPFELKLDNNDNPHIVYKYGPGGLRYASRNGTTWDIQVVDSTLKMGYGAVALDSSGNAHIAYIDRYSGLKYASRTESGWRRETLDSEEETFWHGWSFEIGADNTLYILYGKHDVEDYSLNAMMFVKKNSIWDIQTVASGVNHFGNMVLDSNKFPNFYYVSPESNDTDQSSYKHASWNGSNWNIQPISPVGTSFLALDANDNPSLVYIRSYTDAIYVSWTGTAWKTQTINSDLRAIIECFLAVDSEGNPHICYLAKPPEATLPSEILYLMYVTAETSDFPPGIKVLSISNQVYNTSTIPLEFTIDEPVSKIEYSLDGQGNITINGNTTLTDLANGEHNVTVYATGETGNIGTSETIHFTINVTNETGNNGPTETTQAIDASFLTAIAATVVIVGVVLFLYFKKPK